jgi:hypothetical protein
MNQMTSEVLDVWVLLVAIIILALAIWLIVKGTKQIKAKNQQMTAKGVLSFVTVNHVEGLGVAPNALCDVMQYNDRIEIDSNGTKFQIPISKLRAAVVKNERELIEKGKSVVGRAVIGTLLVPGLGTIIGGMSGIGTKKKKGALNTFLILNYENSRGDMDAVTFLNNYGDLKVNSFVKNLNDTVNVNRAGEVIQL